MNSWLPKLALFLAFSSAAAQSMNLHMRNAQRINNAKIEFDLDVTLNTETETLVVVGALVGRRHFSISLKSMIAGPFAWDNCGLQMEL